MPGMDWQLIFEGHPSVLDYIGKDMPSGNIPYDAFQRNLERAKVLEGLLYQNILKKLFGIRSYKSGILAAQANMDVMLASC